ncbi:hypothetical protein LCGC14_1717090 [marine sediment metagenome]|uniref:Guanylate cyclase domain-containing protein n=1 Tax=marine sediment metagenome TaxID=412755 RepID=A0A0F9HDR8_9ZZZZ
MDKTLKMKLATNEDALIAYVDLIGIKSLYMDKTIPIKKKAETIYDGLFNTFLDAYKNSFNQKEIADHFYINIYADSILISLRKKDRNGAGKMLNLLMSLQLKLAFGEETGGVTIPSRAILSRGEYFSIHIIKHSSAMFNPENTSVSICGGKGMVDLDKKLLGLPVGVYVAPDIFSGIKASEYTSSVKVKGEKLLYILHPQDDINTLLSIADLRWSLRKSPKEHTTLKDAIREGLENGGLTKPFNRKATRDKWYPWIDAHDKRIDMIKRQKSTK